MHAWSVFFNQNEHSILEGIDFELHLPNGSSIVLGNSPVEGWRKSVPDRHVGGVYVTPKLALSCETNTFMEAQADLTPGGKVKLHPIREEDRCHDRRALVLIRYSVSHPAYVTRDSRVEVLAYGKWNTREMNHQTFLLSVKPYSRIKTSILMEVRYTFYWDGETLSLDETVEYDLDAADSLEESS